MLCGCHNQLGNLQLAESQFEAACTDYETALELMSEERSLRRAMILDNLGYCRLLEGRLKEGFGMLFESVRTIRSLKVPRFLARPCISLSYGYLEIARPERALRYAEQALELATQYEDTDSIKHAHFLAAESFSQLGQMDRARASFDTLQKNFYPDAPQVTDLLLAVDTRSLVNFKA